MDSLVELGKLTDDNDDYVISEKQFACLYDRIEYFSIFVIK